MPLQLRHKTVAVAVIHDPESGFLLWNNKRWNGYAFPMRHLEAGDDPAEAALQAIEDRDFPTSLPGASARPLECTGAFGYSQGAREETYYDYHVVQIHPREPLLPDSLHPDLRFFTYPDLQASSCVTWSTRVIATSLVEYQEVVVGLICRSTSAGAEFLLVYKPGHGYFFPAVRRKTHSSLEEMAGHAVFLDAAYAGDTGAKYLREVLDVHPSNRFGLNRRRYRFYLCLMDFPGLDLTQSGNALEQSLTALQSAKGDQGRKSGARGYWNWFTPDELRDQAEMSPQVAVLLNAVAEAGEKRTGRAVEYVPAPIDTSAVELPPEVSALSEQLSQNAHDIWAARRRAEGWKYGPERSDSRHETPCLVPYADLPDSEKQYDRNAAMETLKAIIVLGYRIEKA